jgi:hypothetical protein
MDILEFDGHELALNELAILIRCLVMLKTIIMGERRETEMGILELHSHCSVPN